MNQVSPRAIATLRRMLAALLVAAGVLLAPRAALAALPCSVLDQTSPAPPASAAGSYGTYTSSTIWQQPIQTGKAGQLLGISLEAYGSPGDTVWVRIRKGNAPNTQPVIFQQLVTMTAGPPLVDTKAANLSFAQGEIFVMELQGTNTGFMMKGGAVTPPLHTVYVNGSILPGAVLGFKTYVLSPATAQCDDDQNACTTETCDVVTGMCVHANNTLPCTDNDLCTQNDVCNAGACVPGAPVMCAALDGCHAVGVCNPMTGQCTDPAKQCDDDQNPCTTETCDVVTGMCIHANNTLPCTDNDLCTQNDVCNAGACVPGAPVMCAALDGCHAVGVCNPMTGQCTDPGQPLDCSAKSVCEQDGLCDLASGACVNAAKPDGIPCGKGFCIAGSCSDKAGNTTSGGTSTTGSTSTGTSTGVGGAGGGGAGAAGAGATASGSGEESITAAGGCGCSMPGTSPVRAPWLLLGLLLPAWRRRRQGPRLAA